MCKLINPLLANKHLMKELIELTDGFAKKIVEIENQRKKIGQFLREVNASVNFDTDSEIFEKKLIHSIGKINLENLKVAGVDGGIVKQNLHGIDLILLRAVGVLFDYKNNKLASVQYYPDAIPSPIPIVTFDSFSDIEFEVNSNIERLKAEINTARETIEKFTPDILFLNGSVIPTYTERPAKDSTLFPAYQEMIDAYKKLFTTVRNGSTILAGVVEDSRGSRFCDIVNKKILESVKGERVDDVKQLLNKTNDTNLLTYALQLNERTFVFKYSSHPDTHTVLREFGPETAHQIFTFYLRTAEWDRPVRVDFLGDKGIETVEKISQVLVATSGHGGYGMPSVIIEADQRARLSENDLQMFYSDILSKTGNLPGTFALRRNQRPF